MHTRVLQFVCSVSLGLVLFQAKLTAADTYSNPVLPGDYPDPSVIRVGDDFWATATTSDWAPLFPLLHSRDLVHWTPEGAVFQKRPDWSYGNFWAPEISQFKGKFFVYYVGHKKGGPLNIAVATAGNPRGPWTDHGPMIGQEAGSIDPMPIEDEVGVRYLVWKEDGNSRKQPTPIWAQKLSDDGTKLVGEMKELLRNDAPWEGPLIEGPFVLRHGDWFYLFYSGGACCGRACTYGVGVARAKKLLGPWEKNPANPIIVGNEKFRCPGHGSLVSDKRGRTFFLYHAYETKDFVYVGRQGMLDEVKWNDAGWPVVNNNGGPSQTAPDPVSPSKNATVLDFADDFSGKELDARWQWPQSIEPVARLEKGELVLSPNPERRNELLGAIVAVPTRKGNYTATASIDCAEIKNTAAGLFAFGDKNNALGIYVQEGKVHLLQRKRGKNTPVGESDLPKASKVSVRMTAQEGHRYRFAVQDGDAWKNVGDGDLEGDYLPPWDLGVRVALTAGGGENAVARFDSLKVVTAK